MLLSLSIAFVTERRAMKKREIDLPSPYGSDPTLRSKNKAILSAFFGRTLVPAYFFVSNACHGIMVPVPFPFKEEEVELDLCE